MSTTQHGTELRPQEFIVVWDPVVRWGHWALVAAFAIAYLSAEEEGASPAVLHVWGGYAVGAIVALRMVWGFVGPQRARFSDFLYKPESALRYFIGLLQGHAQRYLGHSPAGGVMVLTLLVALAATVGTGWIAYNGPQQMAQASNPALISSKAYAEEEQEYRDSVAVNGKAEDSTIAELHGTLANITLALVIVHVLGVGLASFVHRENLIAAMMTGKKRAGE